MDLYLQSCIKTSRVFTNRYSTSFSRGIRMLGKKYRDPVYAVYGFVRIADEIVDTFHDQDKKELLDRYIGETYDSIERGLGTNPVLHSFQWAVNEYGIGRDLIQSFFDSMLMDLQPSRHDNSTYKQYIFGSAEVVGLMCLQIFYRDEPEKFEELKKYARKLGEAFQKVNFLRDIQSDLAERERVYFPELSPEKFTEENKKEIEKDIRRSFLDSRRGIKELKKEVRFGVYLAYRYYFTLFRLISREDVETLMSKRISVSSSRKLQLLISSYIRNMLGLI
ncbi:MAG: phytoene/squalene synthase family protein [Bacteroidales bacterium]|jgi:phytoene/squalene synthetase|nr:phytoene/squalene synthase family protein [Bacteroidales bacterium]